MLDNKDLFGKNDYDARGLCKWAERLVLTGYLTNEEYQKLIQYIEDNRPQNDIINWFYNRNNDDKTLYYWEIGKLYPRVRWIKQHIKKQN